ncbi:MAG: papain-like cysteine protease family protein, partial [Kiritimatiellia bacterium]|nr:papain-like cysteine protease family protein [Kiritimatiellia bacterium]
MNIRHYLPKFIAITAVVVLAATSSCLGAVLSVPQYNQEKDQWCWDASSQMILAYYSHTYSQTEIADWAVGGQNIPNYIYNSPDPSMKGCDEVLLHFGNISSSGSSTSDSDLSAIPLSTLANEIANSRPVMIGWAWDQGGGHAVVLRGTDGDSVYVNDPWPSHGQSVQTYDWVCRPYDQGTWTQTLRLTSSGDNDNTYY